MSWTPTETRPWASRSDQGVSLRCRGRGGKDPRREEVGLGPVPVAEARGLGRRGRRHDRRRPDAGQSRPALAAEVGKNDPALAERVKLDAESVGDVRFHVFTQPVPNEDVVAGGGQGGRVPRRCQRPAALLRRGKRSDEAAEGNDRQGQRRRGDGRPLGANLDLRKGD